MPKATPTVFCMRSMTLGAVLMLSCILVGKTIVAPLFNDLSTPSEQQTLELVQDSLEQHSIFSPSGSDLLLAGAAAMVDSLNDPYADFIPPKDIRNFKEESTGLFGGIGVMLDKDWRIIFPLPNSDTAKQGITTGDAILEIDGKNVSTMDSANITTKLSGRPGTAIGLKLRKLNGKIIERQIKRQPVPSITVSDECIINAEHGIAHVSIKSFASTTPEELGNALQRLNSLGMQALILDLRFNLGGQLQDAIDVASYFLSGEIVCRLRPHTGDEYLKYADLQLSAYPDLPLIVLVNELSASGSEVVAAALRDHQRAKLMGTRTYGKGVFQKVISFRDPKFAIKFSAGYYLTPNSEIIESNISDDGKPHGLSPDFELEKQTDEECNAIRLWANRIRVPEKYFAQVAELFPEYLQHPRPKDTWIDTAAQQLISDLKQ
ncbi:MAG: S41 family peptidase [Planctomycetota bacterium]|nr:S41 family peptidase [Planctomycetota bacterium]